MRIKKRSKGKIKIKTIVLIMVSIFFLTISVGYSYLKQSLQFMGKTTIVPQSGGGSGDYTPGNSTYKWSVTNTYGDGTESSPYVCEIKITILNRDEYIDVWEIAFDLPGELNEQITNIWDASQVIYENDRLTMIGQSWNGNIQEGVEFTLNFQIAFNEMVDFRIDNLTINGFLATYEP